MMNNDYNIIKEDLSHLGMTYGDTVLIHSSFRSLGYVEGGIKTLLDAILSVIGDRGTLIAPTLTYRDVSVENPLFNYLETPSCVGAVSEYIRMHECSKRSIHPTHSCAVMGMRSEDFVMNHDLDRTPIGVNSPFRKLPLYGGKILMLGCGTAPNTSVHGVEEYVGVPYLLPEKPSVYRIVLPDRSYEIDYFRHHIKQNGYAQKYSRLMQYLPENTYSRGSIHGSESFLMRADMVWKTGIDVLRNDPYAFVEYVGKS